MTSRTRGVVLVVDDAESIRKALSRALSAEGYAVRTAEHGQAALDVLRNGGVDVIVLDLLMPVLDGFGFLDALRATPSTSEIPVIVMTASGATVSDPLTVRRNVFRCLQKPIDVPVLTEALDLAVKALR